MARMLINLRGVPPEEAEALRDVLARNDVDFYELPASAFSVSAGSIWVRHDADYPRAREVFEAFQDEHRRAARNGPRVPSFLEHLRAEPMRVIAPVVATLLILLLLAWPLFELAN